MRAYFHIKNKNVCAIKYRKFTFEEKKIRLNDKYQNLVSLGDAFATKFQPGCTLSGKKKQKSGCATNNGKYCNFSIKSGTLVHGLMGQ